MANAKRPLQAQAAEVVWFCALRRAQESGDLSRVVEATEQLKRLGVLLASNPSADLMTFDQAAAWLGFDKLYSTPGEVVRNLCRSRKLRFVKLGKRVFIRRQWLEEYLQSASIPPLTENQR